MGDQVFLGTDERCQEIPALTDATESEGEAGNGAIGLEPVFVIHSFDEFGEAGGEPVVVAMKNRVGFVDEIGEGNFGILRPKVGEEVVEENVDDDPGEPSAGRGEEFFCPKKKRVAVGEAIHPTVEHDSGNHFIGKASAKVGGIATGKITEQCTDAGGIGGMGKVKVGQEVQSLWGS